MFAISSVFSAVASVVVVAAALVAAVLVAQLAFAIGYRAYSVVTLKSSAKLDAWCKDIWLNPSKHGTAYGKVWFLLSMITMLTVTALYTDAVKANDLQVLGTLAAWVFVGQTLVVNFVGSVIKKFATAKVTK